MSDTFEKIIEWVPACDKTDPDPNKNYGVHGMDLGFILKGETGAIQLVVYTNWHLPAVAATMKHSVWKYDDGVLCPFKPMPAYWGYHSKLPIYEGQVPVSNECSYTGGICYYDGSTLNVDRVFEGFVEKGDKWLWEEMERYYREIFDK